MQTAVLLIWVWLFLFFCVSCYGALWKSSTVGTWNIKSLWISISIIFIRPSIFVNVFANVFTYIFFHSLFFLTQTSPSIVLDDLTNEIWRLKKINSLLFFVSSKKAIILRSQLNYSLKFYDFFKILIKMVSHWIDIIRHICDCWCSVTTWIDND